MPNKYSAYSIKDVKEYAANLYDKLSHGLDLTFDEEDFLVKLPDDVINDVDDFKQFQQPVEEEVVTPEKKKVVRKQPGKPTQPTKKKPPVQDESAPVRVQRVKKKKPEQPKLTPEQQEEIVEKSPEMTVLNQYVPVVFDDNVFFSETNSSHIDCSINIFVYLRDLGYKNATWYTGPEFKGKDCRVMRPNDNHAFPEAVGYPICEYLNGTMHTLDSIIQLAQQHADAHNYFPPKPFSAMAHPGCRCYLLCWPPTTVEEIPDTAPGIPTFGSPEEIQVAKEGILSIVTPYPVDRWTVLSPEIYEAVKNAKFRVVDDADIIQGTPYAKSKRLYKREYKAEYKDDRIVTAESEWIEDIKPIRISEGYMIQSELGPVRPIPSTYFGFKLMENNEYCIVFLVNFARITVAPKDFVQPIELRPIPLENVVVGSYIEIDDSYGIVIQILADNKVICYMPDFDETMTVTPEKAYAIA